MALLGCFLLAFAPRVAARPCPAPESVSIQSPSQSTPVLQFAAQELQRYLQEITGDAVLRDWPSAKHHFYVGEIPTRLTPAEAQRLHRDLDQLKPDGFLLRRLGPDILIQGNGERGTLYGCYAYLEHLGVRWYFPGKQYELVPHRHWNWDAPLNISESPAFPQRPLLYYPNNYQPVSDWIDFAAKARFNVIVFHYTWPARDWYIDLRKQLLPEIKKRGLAVDAGGHFLSTFLPRALFKEHPDWFPMGTDGKRSNVFNLNPFAAGALEYLNTGAVKHMLESPEVRVFYMLADDGPGTWGQEPGKEKYTASDQALLVYNDLLRRLRQELPNASLAYLSYIDTTPPPQLVKPDPGIVYLYAPIQRCYAHALNDPACPFNQKYRENFEQNLQIFSPADTVVVEYYTDEIHMENMTPPLPDVIREDAQYYHHLGVGALSSLAINTSQYLNPTPNLNLFAKAVWNPDQDLTRPLHEYAALYFGDARVGEYLDQLGAGIRDVVRMCQFRQIPMGWTWMDKESDEAVAYRVKGLEEGISGPLFHASALIDGALQRCRNSVYRQRLQREKQSMEYTLLAAQVDYHRLKSEWLYRIWQHRQDQEAGLRAVVEAALARLYWQKEMRLVGKDGLLKGATLPDDPGWARANDLLASARKYESKTTGTANPEGGYWVGDLTLHLMNQVSGYGIAWCTGSAMVIWTDAPQAKTGLKPGAPGLEWVDAFGRRLSAKDLDLYRAPVVVLGQGMSVVKLYDDLVRAQVAP
jgi:hypothetical protein